LVSTYLFPLAVLITSIPIFMIVIRYNLLRGNVCSRPWAIFWSSILPWLLVIPFQSNGWITTILNWTSLLFASVANLIVPFLLYIMSRRHRATANLQEPATGTGMDEFVLHQDQPQQSNTSSQENLQPAMSAVSVLENNDRRVSVQLPTVVIEPNDTDSEDIDLAEKRLSISTSRSDVIRSALSPSIHRYYGQSSRPSSPLGEPSGRASSTTPSQQQLSPPPSPFLSATNALPRLSTDETTPQKIDFSLLVPSPIQSHLKTPSWLTTKASNEEVVYAMDGPPLSTGSLLSVNQSGSVLRRRWSNATMPERSSRSLPTPPPEDVEAHAESRPHTPPDGISVSVHPVISEEQQQQHSTTTKRFEAFPFLRRWRWMRPTSVAAVQCACSVAIVFGAVVYDVVVAVRGAAGAP